ncbi:MAG: hypothetical protein ACOYOH_15020 [Paracraurococcus sp.]
MPSFARQTDEPCTSCHIGSFGPELTARGRSFKLLGYSEQKDGGSPWWERFSGMVLGSFTATGKKQEGGAAPRYGSNNNFALDQASGFVAGRITESVGAFIQLTESGIDRRFVVDNVDIRFGKAFNIGGVDTILGLSGNNNPTVSDPYNSLAAWGHPYVSSALTPSPVGSPMLNGGLTGQVYGVSAYTLVGGLLYAEAGFYDTISHDVRKAFGTGYDVALAHPATYWRLALQQESNKTLYQVGTFGLAVAQRPTGFEATDRFLDYGVDASFQWLGDRTHIVTAYGRAMREEQVLNGSFAGGASDNPKNHLTQIRGNLSYWYQQTYGLTVGGFANRGSLDALAYGSGDAITGSATGQPNTNGWLAEVAWTPFGKRDSWGGSFANLKLGLQYVGYNRFNGGGRNYDGYGRNAADNNTLYAFLWLAF